MPDLKPCARCGEPCSVHSYAGEYWIGPNRISRCKLYHGASIGKGHICRSDFHGTPESAVQEWNENQGGENV